MKTAGLKILITITLSLLTVTVISSVYGQSTNARGVTNASENAKGKAIIGDVESVIGNKIVVEEKNEKKTTEAVIEATTKIVGPQNRAVRLGSIKKDDLVAIISTDSAKVATGSAKEKKALKVFVKSASDSAQMKRRAVMGVIRSISDSTITLVHQIHSDRVYTIETDAETVVKIKGVESAAVSDIEVGQRIVVVGDISEESILARIIHAIPGIAGGVINRQNIATRSATPVASPSATPTRTPTPTPEATSSASL